MDALTKLGIKLGKLTKKEVSWVLYDCGNSAYSMAITTALLPVYFGMFRGDSGMDLGYFNSLASIIMSLNSPTFKASAISNIASAPAALAS